MRPGIKYVTFENLAKGLADWGTAYCACPESFTVTGAYGCGVWMVVRKDSDKKINGEG